MIGTNRGEFFVDRAGPDDGPPIVFCNALGATTDMWREQIEMLSERYRCFTYDASGHGRSPFEPKPPAITTLAADLEGVVHALSVPQATIIGASIGARTAVEFAATYPGRVDKLILIGAVPKMPEPKMWTDRAADARQDGLAKIADAAMQRWFTADFAEREPERIGEIRSRFVEVDREAYARCCEALGEMDLDDAMRGVRARSLVVVGADDAGAPPAAGENIRSVIGDATLLVIPRAAHMMVIERAAELSAWISVFLSQP